MKGENTIFKHCHSCKCSVVFNRFKLECFGVPYILTGMHSDFTDENTKTASKDSDSIHKLHRTDVNEMTVRSCAIVLASVLFISLAVCCIRAVIMHLQTDGSIPRLTDVQVLKYLKMIPEKTPVRDLSMRAGSPQTVEPHNIRKTLPTHESSIEVVQSSKRETV